MNLHKLNVIVDFIHRQGPLPTDLKGDILSVDDLLAWYGFNEILSMEERHHVKRELFAMAESQRFMERYRLSVP